MDSKNALMETRDMLRDLSAYLTAVHNQNSAQADPALMCFSSRLEAVAGDIDIRMNARPAQEKTA